MTIATPKKSIVVEGVLFVSRAISELIAMMAIWEAILKS